MIERKFRHEMKYLISDGQAELFKSRVCGLIEPDSHVDADGKYTITSLYFDDVDDRCRRENEDGTDPREKFRIRIYNHSPERISLECKRKERSKTHKSSCRLTVEQTEKLMRGEYLPDIENQPPVLRKLTLRMMLDRMRPVVIVDYDRRPYVCRFGNVRITLDSNICSSNRADMFLDPNMPKRPILPVGRQLLEVKWDEYIPDTIYRSLQTDNLQRIAFSKYYLCRKYSLRGKEI